MKKSDLTFKLPLFTVLAAILIAVPLRVYQYTNIIDSETGFFNKTNASVYVLYAVLAVAMLVALVVPYINHKSILPSRISKKTTGFVVISIIMAVGIIIDSAHQLIDYFELYNAEVPFNFPSIQAYVSAQGGTLLLLQAVFGGLSAVYFFAAGLAVGLGNVSSAKFRIPALLPTVWCIFRLLYRFKRTISFVNVSDLLLELFAIVFALMFFLAYAQVTSKINERNIYWKTVAYGLPAAMFSIVCFLPRFIVTITGAFDLPDFYKVHYSDLALAVFVIYIFIAVSKTKITVNNNNN